MKIGMRLGLGAAVMSGLLIALGATSLYQMKNIDLMAADALGHNWDNVKLSHQIAARKPYVDARKGAIDLALSGKNEEALKKFVRETLPLQEKYIDAIQSLITREMRVMDSAEAEAASIHERSSRMMLALSAAALFTAVGGAAWLTLGITRSLAQDERSANQLAKGDLNRARKTAPRFPATHQ